MRKLCIILAVVLLLGIFAMRVRHESRAVPSVRTNFVTAHLIQSLPDSAVVSTQSVDSCQSFWPIPSHCLWGIHNSNYTVQSGTNGEEGLLEYEPPVGDYDYMLAPSVQDYIHLPGGSWNIYRYLGPRFVNGSGYAMLFLTPWGSHFALLHMAVLYINPGRVRGGALVGLSGWPSSLIYSNNSCWDWYSCRSDAHLCLLLSAGARDWFFWIAEGKDVRPLTIWQRYWKPYPHTDGHGHLRPVAKFWITHRYLRHYLDHDQWFGPMRGRKYGYMLYRFRHATTHYAVYHWPHLNAWKVVKT